jgi:membrane protein DedA with SNARE-associated domain
MANWIINTIVSTGYFGILFLMFIENVFPPIPSEFIMPLAGFMVIKDKFSLWGVILSGTIGAMAGSLPLYYLGAKLGKERLKRFIDRYGKWLVLCPDDIDRADKWFEQHGGKAVFFCRLIPGIRSLISIPAGFNRMPLGRFLLLSCIGTAIWTSFLAYAGYFLGTSFSEVEKYLDPIVYIVMGIGLTLYILRLIRIKKLKKKAKLAIESCEA